MPAGMFHYLDCLVLNEMKSEEAKQAKENEALSDEIEESM